MTKFTYIEMTEFGEFNIFTVNCKSVENAWKVVEEQSNSFVCLGFLLTNKQVKELRNCLQ